MMAKADKMLVRLKKKRGPPRLVDDTLVAHFRVVILDGKVYVEKYRQSIQTRDMLSASGSTLFEELGLYYTSPVDGHIIEDLVSIFEKSNAHPRSSLDSYCDR